MNVLTDDLFILASREKLLYPYRNGSISTEDLWDLSIEALDEIFKALNYKYKEESNQESLLADKPAVDPLMEARIAIIRYIVDVKQREAKPKGLWARFWNMLFPKRKKN